MYYAPDHNRCYQKLKSDGTIRFVTRLDDALYGCMCGWSLLCCGCLECVFAPGLSASNDQDGVYHHNEKTDTFYTDLRSDNRWNVDTFPWWTCVIERCGVASPLMYACCYTPYGCLSWPLWFVGAVCCGCVDACRTCGGALSVPEEDSVASSEPAPKTLGGALQYKLMPGMVQSINMNRA